MSPKKEYKEWAMHLKNMVPGDLKVTSFSDDAEENTLDIFESKNSEGILASTIGVMEVGQGEGSKLFTEIIMDARGENENISNVLSTIGFYIVKDRWDVMPGVVFESMVEMYSPELEVKHVMFVAPFQWEEGMSNVALSTKTIYPLLAVPITQGEYEFMISNSAEALESLWASKSTDVLNWGRASAA